MVRPNPIDNPLNNPSAMSQAAVPMKLTEETHGGEDVALYAVGNSLSEQCLHM